MNLWLRLLPLLILLCTLMTINPPLLDTNAPLPHNLTPLAAVSTGTQINNTTLPAAKQQANASLLNMPLCFTSNRGQLDSSVLYYAQLPAGRVCLTSSAIIFDLLKPDSPAGPTLTGNASDLTQPTAPASSERLVFSLNLEDANLNTDVSGRNLLPGRINYFIGNNPSKWVTDIPTYQEAVYVGIYNNIDLRLYGKDGAFTYDFIVHPGGNPDDIRLSLDGIDGLDLSGRDLVLRTALGDLRQEHLKIYQGEGALIREVKGGFDLGSGTAYGFTIAEYDLEIDLVIDPSLVYSTYLGGRKSDSAWGVAVDSSGNAYVVGCTSSDNFIVKNGYQMAFSGTTLDAWVAKINTNATGEASLVYSTYLGGSDLTGGLAIAIDLEGYAYVFGTTAAHDLPVKNAFQPAFGGGEQDAYIAKLNQAGNDLEYLSYLGGDGTDCGQGLARDSSGGIYVTGVTSSVDFLNLNARQPVNGGGSDAFVARFSDNGTALSAVYSTYLGGSGLDAATDVAVDSTGCAYAVGITSSGNFPTTPGAWRTTTAGNIDVFVTKLSQSGNSWLYSTYLGGSGYDGFKGIDSGMMGGIAVDSSGRAYVTGMTNSNDFPCQNAYQPSLAGYFDCFLARISDDGSTMEYATYFGGSEEDFGTDVAVDDTGCAYLTGCTYSANIPVRYPIQNFSFVPRTMTYDVFLCKIDTSISGDNGLKFSTCLGEEGAQIPIAIGLDAGQSVYLVGFTSSQQWPVKNACTQSLRGGTVDAFLARIDTAGDNHPPYIPDNPIPIRWADTITSGVLGWSGGDPDAGDNVTYDVYVSTCYGMNTIPDWMYKRISPDNLTDNTCTISSLLPDKRYYWKIVARDSHGVESYGPGWSFYTGAIPPASTTDNITCITAMGAGDNTTFSATLNGTLTTLGSDGTAVVWFQWCALNSLDQQCWDSWSRRQTLTTTGSFSENITGLMPGHKYWFRTVAVRLNQQYCDCLFGTLKGFALGVPSLNGLGTISVLPSAGSMSRIITIDQNTLPTEGRPPVSFPYGLFSYNISDIPAGSSVTMIITLPEPVPTNTQYWKCDNVTGTWMDVTSLVGHNNGDNILTLTLTDGGLGDSDGVANGTITDPGGPGIPLLPTVTTDNATSIMATTAILHGTLTDTGGAATTVVIYHGPNDGGAPSTPPGTWIHSDNISMGAAGAFSLGVTGLTANAPYYYRCYAENTAGGSWATESANFTTQPALGLWRNYWAGPGKDWHWFSSGGP